MRSSLVAAAFVSGCVMPAPAVEVDGNTIKLNPDEMRKCQTEGGCVVITVEMLRTIVEAAQMCLRRNST